MFSINLRFVLLCMARLRVTVNIVLIGNKEVSIVGWPLLTVNREVLKKNMYQIFATMYM